MTPDKINKNTLDLLKMIDEKINDVSAVVKCALQSGHFTRQELGVMGNRLLGVTLTCDAIRVLLKLKEIENE